MLQEQDGVHHGAAFAHVYDFVCRAPDGTIKWRETIENLTTNVGLNEILDKFWKGAAYTAAHHVGLVSGTPTVVAADTMASHAGWTEVVAYTETVRQPLTLGDVANQSVDNSASVAVFNINATIVIGGGFIATTNNKGGTTGILIGAAAFSGGNKSADNGDRLEVTVTLTAASA